MYKIGEFSALGKVTVKTLRYYEREGLLQPYFVDPNTGYRYYETMQLLQLSKIVSLRQIGVSIEDIKLCLGGKDYKKILHGRKQQIEKSLFEAKLQLQKIQYILEEDQMKQEVFQKELPACIVYYAEATLHDYADITAFIVNSGKTCLALNPGLKCVEPDYCFMNYLDGEYREHDFRVRYSQAVNKIGKEGNGIHFAELPAVSAVCMYHVGSYDTLGKTYAYIMQWLEDHGFTIADFPRERYIDGIWNKVDTKDWLTEIQVPVKQR